MNSEEEYDRIVGSLYDAALLPDTWRRALGELTSWTGANLFHLVQWNATSQQSRFNVHSEGIEGPIRLYDAYYGRIDPRRVLASECPEGEVSACQRHFDASFISRSEYYQDYLAPWGVRHTLSSSVLTEGDDRILVGLVRASERGAFADEEIKRTQRLMPHLRRACRLWMRTRDLHESLAIDRQAAHSTGLAVFGLDANGKIVFANGHAEALLGDDDSLVVKGGRLRATAPADASRLRRAIVQAVESKLASSLPVSGVRSGPQACFVSVASLPQEGLLAPALGRARALVTARRRGQAGTLSSQQLSQIFGLTPAECGAALALLDGKSPEEYARGARLSMSTVRTQLRAVYAKTNTRGQAEVVGLLKALPG